MACAGQLDGEVLRWCWRSDAAKEGLLLRREIEQNLEQLLQRYVAVADDWWQPG
jgi:putative AlgH/UPF0301 family transcriptional regulator